MRTAILTTVVTVALLFTTLLNAQQRGTPSVEFRKISDNLYEIVGGRGSNSGAYIGDDGVLLIDSKMDKASVDHVLEGLRKITDKPIKFLVNTHSDGDHVNGNRYLPQTVTVVAHENCRKEFFGPDRNGNPSEWSKPELLPFTPAVTFRDKMDIYLGSKKVELWYFGVGHTTGDIVVYFPEEKTAFIGDQIFLTRPQLIHSYKGGNSFEHVKTLAKMLAAIQAEKFCSGHSEITDRVGIQNHIAKIEGMQKKVIGLMEQGKTLGQVKGEFDEADGRLVESMYNEASAQKEVDDEGDQIKTVKTGHGSEQTSYKVYPIGKVEKREGKTFIVLDNKYGAGLKGLEKQSHVHVVYWFDKNDTPEGRAILQVHPRGDSNNPLTGVFATHSPFRPNLIAISKCDIVAVKENVIEIQDIDAFDGSPVLDLKGDFLAPRK